MKATRTCSIEGCERPLRARGWCSTHHQRWRTTGTTDDPIPKPAQRTPPADRFRAKLAVRVNGCIEWTGHRNRGGYGQIRVDERMVPAHRFAWELANGPIPDGMLMCHRCDNPPCCNPDHLFLGTHADNAWDMVAKGRHWAARVTHCPQGHPYDEANTYHEPKGGRGCKECRRANQRKQYAKRSTVLEV